ncbi:MULTISPECIES: Holliday junction branch migration protein RuvA [Rheinheimera]|jgi:Holliday junction DNA helicase RuvA|uniref:Holliday junction branch migration complex subunit RuvA n=1 Tax=Rheinheimera aquimaris TaxID=412437 RepID=A0ABP3NTY6_9GAMM|nr:MULTISPECIES: Holliday junction branch migration protein RuvA [Rheinheimera]MCB5213942.1 Holliday junction branch migration protein RuvA [Rheinheimera aquimaris]MCD1597844.1 Holliday junction branch migration protein RuvA [Rheinheimera aquimaris]HBN88673.1 Holliday junction branch migration protein RuvA [Rheinheimera sp.]|tara:strand:+ start:1230 stop:1850 length:621 start_codon:yes stop_codon:yes gene_type:complete
MIGRLRGILLEKQAPDLLIEVAGVGYEVQLPLTSFYQLPATGEEATIYTHFVVREDAQLLYGFVNLNERALFRQLIKANGVGPKLALTILSGMTAQQFVRCVQLDDVSTLVKLPGVGKKTAERLVIEMRDRLKDWGIAPNTPVTDALILQGDEAVYSPQESAEHDAIGALVSLGYSQAQADKAVQKVKQNDMSSEQLIKAALRSMM